MNQLFTLTIQSGKSAPTSTLDQERRERRRRHR
jgi:hypothetical protein